MCVCVSECVCLSLAALSHYCMDPDVTWGNGSGCYHNTAQMQNVSKCLYSLYAQLRLSLTHCMRHSSACNGHDSEAYILDLTNAL